MKNVKKWQPSRILPGDSPNQWVVNSDEVAACSKFIVERQLPYYIAAIRDNVGGRLLDCGCGQVPYYGVYKDLVSDVECIDWEGSPHQIQYADKFVDLNGPLPYDDNEFDTVLLSDVLEHIYEPTVLLGEIHRVLKEGGTLICFVPYMYWLHEDPHDYYRYTEYALNRLCDDSGMQVKELYAYGGGADVVFDSILKLNRNNTRTVKVLTKLFTYLTKTKKYRNNSAWGKKKMPLGYVLIAEKSGANQSRPE